MLNFPFVPLINDVARTYVFWAWHRFFSCLINLLDGSGHMIVMHSRQCGSGKREHWTIFIKFDPKDRTTNSFFREVLLRPSLGIKVALFPSYLSVCFPGACKKPLKIHQIPKIYDIHKCDSLSTLF